MLLPKGVVAQVSAPPNLTAHIGRCSSLWHGIHVCVSQPAHSHTHHPQGSTSGPAIPDVTPHRSDPKRRVVCGDAPTTTEETETQGVQMTGLQLNPGSKGCCVCVGGGAYMCVIVVVVVVVRGQHGKHLPALFLCRTSSHSD